MSMGQQEPQRTREQRLRRRARAQGFVLRKSRKGWMILPHGVGYYLSLDAVEKFLMEDAEEESPEAVKLPGL